MNEFEEWRDIPDYEGMYQVSNLGRVKSLVRMGRKSERVLSGSPITTGYLVVQLRKDNVRTSKLIHRIVLTTFSPREDAEEMTVNHKDLNIKNNSLENLEWCTQEENTLHYWENVTTRKDTPVGFTHHLSKMTLDKVQELRRLYKENIITNKTKLGEMFGIGESTVRQILKGESWKVGV